MSLQAKGRLVRYHSNFYYVDVLTGDIEQTYECSLKGLLKKASDQDLLVGDWVELDNLDISQFTGRICQILPRDNNLTRPKIANVDQVIVVYSIQQPAFDSQQLDRYLTHATLAGIPVAICLSKCDLAESEADITAIQSLYHETLGYPLIATSIQQPDRLEQFQKLAARQVTVLAGPSGVGKSSLLNALKPDLQLRVGEVSDKIERGQHTTRNVSLIKIQPDTFVADTPGFSHLKFDTVLPIQIAEAFPEFAEANCEFRDCLHMPDSEGCDREGHISESRYTSYCAFVAEAMNYKLHAQQSSSKEEFGFKQTNQANILKLKSKNRQVSRRTERQQVNSLLDSEDDDDDE